jgi:hypothetical protein
VLARDADLLEPQYYLSANLTADAVFQQLRGFRQQSPAWIVGEAAENYLATAKRLRKKGMVGPLWSYFAIMQRLGLVTAER